MLSLLGWIYAHVAELRNKLYDTGMFESASLGAHTVSIGNITTGGTGKTPLVAYTAELLAARGEKVCILTRGYGRANPRERVLVSDWNAILADSNSGGDEPTELAQRLLGKAIVIADSDRIAAAEWAKRKFEITAFVLDDGFQHRKVKRDVDVVCIDATDPIASARMLPAGRLREQLHNLDRADVIVITRSDLVNVDASIRAEIKRLNAHASVFAAKNKIVAVTGIRSFHGKVTGMAGEMPSDEWNKLLSATSGDSEGKVRLAAFCALGNPSSFFAHMQSGLAETGPDIVLTMTKAFADHHAYSQADIDAIETQARSEDSVALITTAKDAVKLRDLRFSLPCFVVEIEMAIDDPEAYAALL